ncbi:copper homeostasis protein CutC [Streptomyces sp. AJS327]|nr:copper homeostasis protein CutC [Streptomyces sp. AJS327]
MIALSAEDATAARAGGADRLEVAADMAADGLTPSRETVGRVREAVDLPLRVMLRARGGFTAGGSAALDALTAQAAMLRAEGAEEFVFGFLDDAGRPDFRAVVTVAEAVEGCRWTFHRAIDSAADRPESRRRLAELPGLDTYLTAGSAEGVDAGRSVLVDEAARTRRGEPGYESRLLVGGGLRLDHVPGLLEAGIDAFHIGRAARPEGWAGPVAPEAVAEWRAVLDK